MKFYEDLFSFYSLVLCLVISTLMACSNPLGDSNSIDSSFSPGGDATAPSVPVIISQTGDPSFTSSPTLTWQASTDDTQLAGYEIGIGTTLDSDNVLSFSDIGNVTSYQITNINPQLILTTTYYLLVRSVDTAGNKSTIVAGASWSPGLVLNSGAYQLPESPFYYSDCSGYFASNYYNSEGDGNYWLDLDGPGGLPAFIGSCMMDSEGGGWTLVLNYVHQGGTNPATNGKTLSLPTLNSSTLGDDESTNASSWGHGANNLLVNMSFSEMLFSCSTSAHARVMNFKTSLAALITYSKVGTGGSTGLDTNFTPLAGHTANLPGTRDTDISNQGDEALTAIPFAESGVGHWSIRAAGGRWECDDFPLNDANDTIHRTWVR